VIENYPGRHTKIFFYVQSKCGVGSQKMNFVSSGIVYCGSQNSVSVQAKCRVWHPKICASVLEECAGWQPKISLVCRRNNEGYTQKFIRVLQKTPGCQPKKYLNICRRFEGGTKNCESVSSRNSRLAAKYCVIMHANFRGNHAKN
jgi:hypothetical protein